MTGVFLRALTMDDLEFTYKWHSNEQLYKTLVGPFRYVSKDAEREWLQGKVKYSTNEINLLICLVENNQPIGMVSVREIDWVSRSGHLAGIMIGEPQFQSKGFGHEALILICRHCFKDLCLNKIYAYILEDNINSRKMFKKSGFIIEGTLRQHVFKDGQFKDLTVVGLCAGEFMANLAQE